MDVNRDYAGGFGVAVKTDRNSYGHGSNMEVVPYISLVYSASVLEEAGYDVTFLDAQAEKMNIEQVLLRIHAIKPDLIVSVINLPSIYGDVKLFESIKKNFPSVKIICMGTMCKILPGEVLKNGTVDCAITGEAEGVLVELLSKIKKNESIAGVKGIAFMNEKNLIRTPQPPLITDLDSLPFPPYHLMPMNKYRTFYFGMDTIYAPIWSSRGCPFQCSYYCPYPLGFGKKIRYRSPKNVVDEIDYIVTEFEVGGIIFRDQNFTLDYKRTEEICDIIIEKKIDINWLCETRLDKVPNSLLRKMRKAGCTSIHFGLETGDPDILNKTGKPGMKLSTARDAIKRTKKNGIVPTVNVIIGLPGDTWKSIENTLKVLFKLHLDSVQFNMVTPYPGTKFFEDAERKGLIAIKDWSKYTGIDPVMRTENLTIEELKNAQKYLERNFYRTPPFLVKTERIAKKLLYQKGRRQRVARFLRNISGRKEQKICELDGGDSPGAD